jgi:hypothetical protein
MARVVIHFNLPINKSCALLSVYQDTTQVQRLHEAYGRGCNFQEVCGVSRENTGLRPSHQEKRKQKKLVDYWPWGRVNFY